MFDEMKQLAEKKHEGQFRNVHKGEVAVPYIRHPESVAKNLLDWGEPEDSVAIGIAWGHDLLEDTEASLDEIIAASDDTVAAGIRLLTHEDGTDKRRYLQNVARSGNREVLLVKISDRIQNSRDFLKLEGPLRAFRYLHDAECIFDAVQKLPQDTVLANAVAAWMELDESLRKDARHDAIRGCLLGGAVGDALGAPVEFMSKTDILRKYGKDGVSGYVEFADGTGAITDDTQMTLFTAEGILRSLVRNNERGICCAEDVVHNAYLRWLKTQGIVVEAAPSDLNSGWLIKEKSLYSRRAPGRTCINALRDDKNSNKSRNNSKGCGSVMRMAPAGLFSNPERAYEFGCRFSAITHGHPTAITAGGAFAMLIDELQMGKSLDDALDIVLEQLDGKSEAAETCAALRKARTAGNISELGEGWVAEEALAIGVYCALKHTWDFRSGVLEAVNITGDSDSSGAITGNILGVINGEKAIPSDWLSNLREYKIVSQVADDLAACYEEDEEGHVTCEWWEKYPGF